MINTETGNQVSNPGNDSNQTLPQQTASRFNDSNFISEQSEIESIDTFKKKYQEQFHPFIQLLFSWYLLCFRTAFFLHQFL